VKEDEMKSMRFVVLTLALSVFSMAAFADEITSIVNVANTQLAATPGPYATVDLKTGTDSALSATVIFGTVTMDSNFQLFGNGSPAFGMNFSSGSASNYEVVSSSVTSGFSASGSGQMDGFGTFAITFNGPTAANAASLLSFEVECLNSTSQVVSCTSATQLVGDSTGGGENQPSLFAVHVAPTNGNPTGFAGAKDSTLANTPEPGSMLLLGTGLLGLGSFVRRRLL